MAMAKASTRLEALRGMSAHQLTCFLANIDATVEAYEAELKQQERYRLEVVAVMAERRTNAAEPVKE